MSERVLPSRFPGNPHRLHAMALFPNRHGGRRVPARCGAGRSWPLPRIFVMPSQTGFRAVAGRYLRGPDEAPYARCRAGSFRFRPGMGSSLRVIVPASAEIQPLPAPSWT
ncbi:hypothetical protein Pden_4333 [Paracoccus denitrificans PD1222]|uniref:Uncharacterized protein n=1 Tax=Paracoccus denitrificans (strain Pd 1222) TaxID=318586 RepID=A1BA53_PARDP|nr:hypothetical protein Pden_4333 [Paracoccus denitrificans PD1222]